MSALRIEVQRALDAGHPEQAWDIAAAARDADAAKTRLHADSLLRFLAPKLPEAAWTEHRESLAGRLRIHRVAEGEQIGRVVFPAVRSEHGRFIGVRAQLAESDDGRFTRELDAVRALLKRPELRFSLSFDFDAWSGDSAGLAVGLAAYSAARRLALSPMIAATGALDDAGRVRPVGRLPEKLRLRHAARPRCSLLVPADDAVDHPSVFPVSSLEEAIRAAGLRHADDPGPSLGRIRELDEQGDWLAAAREAAVMQDRAGLTDEERLELLLLRLLASNHVVDTAAQAELGPRVDALVAQVDPERREVLARAIGSRAVQRLDNLDLDGARETLVLADSRFFPARTQVHIDGPRALLATFCGEHELALKLRQDNVARASDHEKPRCLGDLADALLRLGRADEALARVEEALALAEQENRRRGYQQRTTRYLRLHRARALASRGQREEARAALEPLRYTPGLDPRIRAELLLAEILGDTAVIDRFAATLSPDTVASKLITALLDRSRARLGDAEAAARLCALPAFRGLDWEEAARRLPY